MKLEQQIHRRADDANADFNVVQFFAFSIPIGLTNCEFIERPPNVKDQPHVCLARAMRKHGT